LKIASTDVATNSEICLEERIFLQQLASFKARLATTSEFASLLPRINFKNWICLEECLYNIEKIAWRQRFFTTSQRAFKDHPYYNFKGSCYNFNICLASNNLSTSFKIYFGLKQCLHNFKKALWLGRIYNFKNYLEQGSQQRQI
jgi:hypothetical protein